MELRVRMVEVPDGSGFAYAMSAADRDSHRSTFPEVNFKFLTEYSFIDLPRRIWLGTPLIEKFNGDFTEGDFTEGDVGSMPFP